MATDVISNVFRSVSPQNSLLEDFKKIGEFLDRCCQIALKIQSEKGKKLKDFEAEKKLRKNTKRGYPGGKNEM